MLVDVSLPFVEVSADGKVCVAKADNNGEVLNHYTCTVQVLSEVGDPEAYVTPDVDCGWKGWGEISYGGFQSVKGAEAAEFLVRSWIEEVNPSAASRVISYIIGVDSLRVADDTVVNSEGNGDIRLRMDGLFEQENHAVQFTEFIALYTNGPAGGGGISTGHKKEVSLRKELVDCERVCWKTHVKYSSPRNLNGPTSKQSVDWLNSFSHLLPVANLTLEENLIATLETTPVTPAIQPAPSGQKIRLYKVAHSRAGDKGNDINFSIISHFHQDILRQKMLITPEWVKGAVSPVLRATSFPNSNVNAQMEKEAIEHLRIEIYEAKGVLALNVVVRNILDGGVNCSRRIAQHGKSISDLILNQQIALP